MGEKREVPKEQKLCERRLGVTKYPTGKGWVSLSLGRYRREKPSTAA